MGEVTPPAPAPVVPVPVTATPDEVLTPLESVDAPAAEEESIDEELTVEPRIATEQHTRTAAISNTFVTDFPKLQSPHLLGSDDLQKIDKLFSASARTSRPITLYNRRGSFTTYN